MFRAVTRDIAVEVVPTFLAKDSAPDEGRWVWAYRVTIENLGAVSVQLLARRWKITDANGVLHEVAGPGVVGEQPIIGPGERYEYSSGCPLTTASGIMVGSYMMVTELGETIDVAVPAFSLDMPNAVRVLN